jgi:hypothetical protein
MIAICRDPDGFVKMTDRVIVLPSPVVVPVPGDFKGLSAEAQGFGEVEAGAGR